jgi:hypothetical protein
MKWQLRVSAMMITTMVVWLGLTHPTLAVNWSECYVNGGTSSVLTNGTSTSTAASNPVIPDLGQAFILGNAMGYAGSSGSKNHLVTTELGGVSDITLTRGGTSGDLIAGGAIIYCEGGDKIKVQRGTITINPGSNSNTGSFATPVADIDNAIVLVSVRTDDTSANDANNLVAASLQNTNTVIVRRAGTPATTVYAHYQVVEFLAGSDVTVQTDTATLTAGQASTTISLPTAVATDRTWVYCSYTATNNGLQQTAIGCYLSDSSTVTVARSTAGAYTNRVRVYTVTWPRDTVTVQAGTSTIDNTDADSTTVINDISIPLPGADAERSFAFVTNVTQGTGTEYPRNRWVSYVLNNTTLRTQFGRSDASGSSDATTKYWQVINFPAPYAANGWGYIGNSTDGVTPTAMLSFSCTSITADTTWAACGDGSSGTRYDYGVKLDHGGCGSACDVTGQAWIGSLNTGETAGAIGVIDFDPAISGANAPPNVVGDDTSTAEDERLNAHWNEDTGELYGWARIRSLRDYESSNGGTANDWGWINLRGTNTTTGAEYGVRFDADDLALSGWGWNGDGSAFGSTTRLAGTGLGWIKFDLNTSGTVSEAWLRTTQANVYSQGGFSSTVDPTSFGEYNSTYLILSNGTVTNFSTELGSVVTEDLGGIPTDNTSQVFRGSLGSIYVNELIDQAGLDGNSITGDCTETSLTTASHLMGGEVYYCSGDMTINNNLTFYNTTGSNIGSGTIVVGGDLYVNDNINYSNNDIDQHINNLASVAFIVQGRVEIAPSVSEMAGAYVILGDAHTSSSAPYDFATGDSLLPFELNGLVMARSFNFQRRSLGSSTDAEPAEDIRYDGRVLANPPPGLENFASTLPSYE